MQCPTLEWSKAFDSLLNYSNILNDDYDDKTTKKGNFGYF